MSKITPCLWFAHDAEEAARFYTSLLPGSGITDVQRSPGETPSGPAGMVLVVRFTLAGQSFLALNGGTPLPYTEALSLQIDCADQDEVDRLWTGLTANGGEPSQCGWVKDRWGVSWQVVPSALPRLLADPDPARAARALQAMLGMTRIDIAALERAADGN